jgi:hypothetical protein
MGGQTLTPCRLNASVSAVAGLVPTAPGFVNRFVSLRRTPASKAVCWQGKLKQKPILGGSSELKGLHMGPT